MRHSNFLLNLLLKPTRRKSEEREMPGNLVLEKLVTNWIFTCLFLLSIFLYLHSLLQETLLPWMLLSLTQLVGLIIGSAKGSKRHFLFFLFSLSKIAIVYRTLHSKTVLSCQSLFQVFWMICSRVLLLSLLKLSFRKLYKI